MPPIADFVCNSKRCRRKDGSAPVYELPIKATHCPMGHKQIVRLYNKINIRTGKPAPDFDGRHTSSSKAARVDALVGPAMDDADRRQSELKAGQRWRGDNGMVRPVPISQMGMRLQEVFSRGQATSAPIVDPRLVGQKAEVAGQPSGGILGDLAGGSMPRVTVARDTEHKVVRGRDGQLAIDKA